MKLRIATWNLERPRTHKTDKINALKQKMQMINADIWILTESHEAMSPNENYQGAHTEHIESRHTDGERRSSIWSRFPINQIIETHDPETAVCVDLQTPEGPVIVYATVIPYDGAGTGYPYRSGMEFVEGLKTMELHRASIERHRTDWQRIRAEHPDHEFIVAGDFNQHRDGVGSYGARGREPLSNALSASMLSCVTEQDFKALGKLTTRRNLDHICLSQRLVSKVTEVDAWEAGTLPNGKRHSDHNGVWVDLA